jgi:ATP-binding cassette subfamily B protein
MNSPDVMPAALPAMWRALKRGYEAEPTLLAAALTLSIIAAIPDALIALWLKLIADSIASGRHRLLLGAAIALGVSAVGTWFLRLMSDRTQRRFRDRLTIALESHVARLQASVATIAHHERPEYLDRLAVLRDQVFVLDHMYMSLFSTCGWLIRLGVTVVLLMSIHPALAFLAAFAIPAVLTSSWRPAVERAAEERGASASRLARHLFTVATAPASGKEVRVAGIEDRLVRLRRDTWERWYAPVASARWGSAVWYALAWLIFSIAYVAALVFVTTARTATTGDVLLVLAAGSRLSAYISATVGEISFLFGFWLDGSRRLAWLEDYAAAQSDGADLDAPERLTEGIRFDHVSFAYPGTDRRVLDDVNLELRPGAVVAIVGENGAGKSTLVKLIARMYEPDQGRITVNGIDLSRIRAEDWRSRMAGAFQDFYCFELPARHCVGVGDVPRIDDTAAVAGAIDRAGASDLIERMAQGLDTQLGPTWPGGVEVSFGQWQKLALARGFMRDRPLVLVLDEPTAALDAETEHALFERYAHATRGAQTDDANDCGRITILVSHRFSTVRMADQIVVIDGARVVEVGSHDELIARRGQYSELYNIQAAAYR